MQWENLVEASGIGKRGEVYGLKKSLGNAGQTKLGGSVLRRVQELAWTKNGEDAMVPRLWARDVSIKTQEGEDYREGKQAQAYSTLPTWGHAKVPGCTSGGSEAGWQIKGTNR